MASSFETVHDFRSSSSRLFLIRIVQVSESEASAGHEVNAALVRSGTELGPQGIAEFNRQIDQRVAEAEVTGRDRETSHFADDEESYIDASCGEEREDVAEVRKQSPRSIAWSASPFFLSRRAVFRNAWASNCISAKRIT